MFAVHTDGLVMGVGETEALAYANAESHGSEDDSLLNLCEITDDAARYVKKGGDCRALIFRIDANGEDVIMLRKTSELPK